MSRPGPPRLQQHVRFAFLCGCASKDKRPDGHWSRYVSTSSSRHRRQWTLKVSSVRRSQVWKHADLRDCVCVLGEGERLGHIIAGIWTQSIPSPVPSACQVSNQCSHRAGGALQRHISPGEPPLRRGLSDPFPSRVQHLRQRGPGGVQTDPTGERCRKITFPYQNEGNLNVWSNLTSCFQGIITLILATDMARHGEILDSFKQKVDNFDFTNEEHVTCVSTNCCILISLPREWMKLKAFSFQLKMVLIKCCDISNEVRPTEVAEPWVDCLLEEYFMQVTVTPLDSEESRRSFYPDSAVSQSDREKSEGLPVAPFMDRDKVTKPTAQIGFIKFVLIPMFETVMKVGHLVRKCTQISTRMTLLLCPTAFPSNWGDHGATFERLSRPLRGTETDRRRHDRGRTHLSVCLSVCLSIYLTLRSVNVGLAHTSMKKSLAAPFSQMFCTVLLNL